MNKLFRHLNRSQARTGNETSHLRTSVDDVLEAAEQDEYGSEGLGMINRVQMSNATFGGANTNQQMDKKDDRDRRPKVVTVEAGVQNTIYGRKSGYG